MKYYFILLKNFATKYSTHPNWEQSAMLCLLVGLLGLDASLLPFNCIWLLDRIRVEKKLCWSREIDRPPVRGHSCLLGLELGIMPTMTSSSSSIAEFRAWGLNKCTDKTWKDFKFLKKKFNVLPCFDGLIMNYHRGQFCLVKIVIIGNDHIVMLQHSGRIHLGNAICDRRTGEQNFCTIRRFFEGVNVASFVMPKLKKSFGKFEKPFELYRKKNPASYGIYLPYFHSSFGKWCGLLTTRRPSEGGDEAALAQPL